ncbi:tetratricopeptide repeat protein [Dehalococcoidia bacterium]|nr:tetratricopeptide repeat protein [Dehalococcoidia bacterium]
MKLENILRDPWKHMVAAMLEDLTENIKQCPDDPDRYYERGCKYLNLGGLDSKAIEDFSQAIYLDSGHCPAFYARGFSHAKLGEHKKAIGDYGEALKINHYLGQVHYGMGVSYDALGDQNSAIYHYVKAINLDPDSSTYKQALDNYSEVAEMQPWNSEALYNLGMVGKEMRDYESAIENFTKMIRIQPDWEDGYLRRAQCYEAKNEYQLASEDYSHVIRIRNDGGPFGRRGYCFQRIGEYQKAIDDYTTVIENDRPHYKTYLHRATCYKQIGLDEAAKRDYQKSAELE